MKKTDIIKIVNEEITGGNFLNNSQNSDERDDAEILKDEKFQKQFICDSILNGKNRISTHPVHVKIGGNYDDYYEYAKKLVLEYQIIVEYNYDRTKKPIRFSLFFDGDSIDIKEDGEYYEGHRGISADVSSAPYYDAWFTYINWDDINVFVETMDNEEISFVALENAPSNIRTLFIISYVANIITKKTGLEIKIPQMDKNVSDMSFCG